MMRLSRLAISAALLIASVCAASAQNWPSKPIKFIVTQAAGGAPDIICRLITDRLTQALGQQVIVENRPGAGNTIGMQAAARSAPDGYTFVFATAASLVTNPYTFRSLPYDPIADFTPVSMVAKNPFLVLANADVPVKNLADLLAREKADPGKLTYATDGPRNLSGIIASWINKLGGVNILQVPYATMPQGIQDTVAGRVQLTVLAVPVAAPHIASGKLRPLAVTWQKRVPNYPDVAPIADLFPGTEVIGWFVIAAPAGTPADIVGRMNREMDKILKDPGIVAKLATVGFFTEGADTPEATRAFVKAQYESWGKLANDIGLKPE